MFNVIFITKLNVNPISKNIISNQNFRTINIIFTQNDNCS